MDRLFTALLAGSWVLLQSRHGFVSAQIQNSQDTIVDELFKRWRDPSVFASEDLTLSIRAMGSETSKPSVIPDSRIFKDLPIVGEENLVMNVGDAGHAKNVSQSYPWQAYNGQMVQILAYGNYDTLVKMVNDSDYIPMKAMMKDVETTGDDLGIVQMTVVKYTDTSTGPYDELVISTAVVAAADKVAASMYNCATDDVACVAQNIVANKYLRWFVIEMWLDSELPIATGQQFVGINKVMAPSLEIDPKRKGDSMAWTFSVDDVESDTYISGHIQEANVTGVAKLGEAFQYMMRSMASVVGIKDPPGMPADMFAYTDQSTSRLDEPYHVNYIVQPKGIYPKNFGNEINPMSYSMLHGGESEYMDFTCNITDFSVKGYYAPLQISPKACYFVHGVQAVILPPMNVGPWKEFKQNQEMRDPDSGLAVHPTGMGVVANN